MKNKSRFAIILLAIISVIAVICSVLLPGISFSSSTSDADSGYVVNNYDINMIVNENNSYSITESINCSFDNFGTVEKHGIYRYIPYVNKISREVNGENKTFNYGADVDIKGVNQPYSVEKESGNYVLQIGSEDIYVNGKTVNYIIKYDFTVGNDRIDEYDFLYYNLIGTGWGVKLNNVTYSITMPKSFDETKSSVFYGEIGSVLTNESTYQNNVISGSINSLSAHEALTVSIDLDEGYFITSSINYNVDLIYILVAIIIFLIMLIFVVKTGAEEVVPVVTVVAPNDMNPSEMAFYYNGELETKDVTSLIIYWANKGYITIKAEKDETYLTKIKDLESGESKAYERKLFDKLFDGKDTIDLKTRTDAVCTEVNVAKLAVKKDLGQFREDPKKNGRFILYVIIALAPMFLTIMHFSNRLNYTSGWFIMPMIISTIAFILISKRTFSHSNVPKLGKIAKFASIIALISMIVCAGVFFSDRTIDKYFVAPIVTLISGMTIILSARVIGFKKEVREKLGTITGFRDFIDKCEKDRMKLLLDDNPNYFFDVLPYAIVLGVSDQFIERFKDLAIDSPSWYVGSTMPYSSYYFARNMNRNLNSFNASVTSAYAAKVAKAAKSNRSGGGHGGSGFSGGGFGGGGGGSW